jgi:hypothetical protein
MSSSMQRRRLIHAETETFNSSMQASHQPSIQRQGKLQYIHAETEETQPRNNQNKLIHYQSRTIAIQGRRNHADNPAKT